jgi:peptidyl-prolyl cis-trans isomerase C
VNKHRDRPLARAGLLALLVAFLTVVPAFAQGPATTADDADPVLIRLGGTVERLSDVAWRFEVAMRSFASGQGLPYTEDIAASLRSLLPEYIEQRSTELVLLREAERRGLTPDEESVQATLERLRSSVAPEEYDDALAGAGFPSEAELVTLIRESDLIGQVITAIEGESQPTEEQLRVRYLADIAMYTEPETFCARHILVADEALAQEIIDKVNAGEDFAELAGVHGTDGTARTGGDLGCFQRGMMIEPFEDAVVAATVGSVTGPVETQFGYHAVLVYDHRPAAAVPFEDVRDYVAESVAADNAYAVIDGLIRVSGVVTYPERLAPPTAE